MKAFPLPDLAAKECAGAHGLFQKNCEDYTLDDKNELKTRKPNRDQYRAQRKAKYEKKQQDEDLYELLRKERLQQGHKSASGGTKASVNTKRNAGMKRPEVPIEAGRAAVNRRMQEAQAAYQAAAKPVKKTTTVRNSDLYMSDPEMEAEALETAKRKGAGRSGGTPSVGAIFAILVLCVLVIGAATAFSIAAKHNKENGGTSGTITPSAAPTGGAAMLQADREITAILEQVNTSAMTLQVWSKEDGDSILLNYSSATDIQSKYGELQVAGQLQVGEIVEIAYNKEQKKALSVQVSKEAWEVAKQTNLGVNPNRALVSLRTRNYEYTDALHVYDQGKKKQLKDIAKEDVVTLRGIGNEVYVIQVDRGHGYLTLDAEEDYLGGSLYVNGDFKAQITEKMVLQISEGTYEITVENQDLTATVETTITRNDTTVLDLTEYARVPDPVCQITFQIYPKGAILYLNEEDTYYKNPLSLPYGVYEIRVESGGYVTYEGTLNVKDATMKVSISLSEEAIGDADGDKATDTGENGNADHTDAADSSADGETGTDADKNVSGSGYIDNKHSIFVYSEDGAEVYMNGDYMGVTANGVVEFEKLIGNVTLKIIRGTEEKSYTVPVADDGEDFKFHCYFGS